MPRYFTRQTDAKAFNEVLNHPDVRPWIADEGEGYIDVSARVADPNTVCLLGEHGGCIAFKLLPGLYELHSAVLPTGRGEWYRNFAIEAFFYAFTSTDAWEVLTRVPHGHIAARAASLTAGMKLEFIRPDCCVFRGKAVPVHIYSLRLQDWLNEAPWLVEIGDLFHVELRREAARIGVSNPAHEEDENHSRHVGACYAMARGGQFEKALAIYNRWALISRHAPIRKLSDNPPTFFCDIGAVRLNEDGSLTALGAGS